MAIPEHISKKKNKTQRKVVSKRYKQDQNNNYRKKMEEEQKQLEAQTKSQAQDMASMLQDRYIANLKMFEVFTSAIRSMNAKLVQPKLVQLNEKLELNKVQDEVYTSQLNSYKESLKTFESIEGDFPAQAKLFSKIKNDIALKQQAASIIKLSEDGYPIPSKNVDMAISQSENLEKSINDNIKKFTPQYSKEAEDISDSLKIDESTNQIKFQNQEELFLWLDAIEEPQEKLYRQPLSSMQNEFTATSSFGEDLASDPSSAINQEIDTPSQFTDTLQAQSDDFRQKANSESRTFFENAKEIILGDQAKKKAKEAITASANALTGKA